MSVRLRLFLLVVLLATLPALAASLLSRQLITSTFRTSLSHEIDTALEAGLRRAQSQLMVQRHTLKEELEAWCDKVNIELARGVILDAERIKTRFPWTASNDDRVELLGRGSPLILQKGHLFPEKRTRARTADSNPQQSTGIGRLGEPPDRILVKRELADGRWITVERPVPVDWIEDAASIATGLQIARALQIERDRIGREFWLPFLTVYAFSMLIGLLMAWWLARGLTQPLGNLVRATRSVGKGDWHTRVELKGGGEVEQLSNSFNRMVATLDAQHRRLVDLETMAGWREMARALAHEVKNPLTPIQLTVEEMREQYHGDDEEYRSLLEECSRIVVEEVESLRNVVQRFREFSRPVTLRHQALRLNHLLRDLGALQKDLEVEYDLDSSLDDRWISADSDRLRQVLINLVENARQAQANQKLPRLILRSRMENEYASLIVEDAGPGIPERQRDRIFDPYHTGTAGGLGLGLSLVKGIVLAHGGHIRVEEGMYGGAAFWVYLPLVE